MKRTNFSGKTKWEEFVGYSRAVKVGSRIYVSGTTAVDENGKIVGVGSSYLQTRFILQKISNVLTEMNADLSDVVRTRMFTVNINDWIEISRAHSEFFKDIKPASTLVEVSNLIEPELLIEIEVEAEIIKEKI